ncbi:MAG: ABC transporter ATP-binding protein [Methylobacter sp.]|nr:ABC transporter ATP-binding protein [Methylobacter sp.]
MTNLIEAEHLTRYYSKHCAVNDVSFTLAKGEVLGFLGPNGAGKTTTMQMLCGNLAPSAGQIKINGFDLLDQPKSAKLSLGYLPDTPPLYRELSVDEFLSYCAQLHGIAKASVTQAVNKAKERCGLTEVADRLIANLSKGFQQRVGIAQAILHNPEVIILDEPTVGLDPIQIREIRTLIRELGQDHGVILSTHILTEVQESCSHVQIIHQGQLILNETIAGLNQQMDTGTLEVATRLTADANALLSIPGVTSIDNIAGNRIKIHHSVTANPAEQIAEKIIAAGWGLQELTPIKRSMEDIFITLTKEHGDL